MNTPPPVGDPTSSSSSSSINVLLLFPSQVLNGHFVHYFAPKDLPAVPKNVVFVIDTSASMSGTKIRQVERHLEANQVMRA